MKKAPGKTRVRPEPAVISPNRFPAEASFPQSGKLSQENPSMNKTIQLLSCASIPKVGSLLLVTLPLIFGACTTSTTTTSPSQENQTEIRQFRTFALAPLPTEGGPASDPSAG